MKHAVDFYYLLYRIQLVYKDILDRQETYRSNTAVRKPSVSAETLQGHINYEDLLSIVTSTKRIFKARLVYTASKKHKPD